MAARQTTSFPLALALLCAFILPAQAGSAFWHGVRSNDWNGGISSGQSNWYSLAPPNGTAQPVPDITAKFAPGALRTAISIAAPTVIKNMDFRNNPPPYVFTVTDTFSLIGVGITNAATNTNNPLFIVQAIMVFLNKSTPGHSDYDIRLAGTLNLDLTTGPANNHVIVTGEIKNAGRLQLGLTTARMAGDFTQTATGFLKIDKSTPLGGLIVGKDVTLSGELHIEGRRDIAAGRYLLIDADHVIGKFATVTFARFPAKATHTIEYKPDKVTLIVTRPP
jgi:hypothetical protein